MPVACPVAIAVVDVDVEVGVAVAESAAVTEGSAVAVSTAVDAVLVDDESSFFRLHASDVAKTRTSATPT